MAEIAVLLAVRKISIAVAGEMLKFAKLAKKSDLVTSLPTNMELIKEELEMINVFLKKISSRGCSDTVLDTWIIQVRRLSFDIEDVADQFIYAVSEQRSKGSCSNLRKIVNRPQSLLSLDRIAIEVEKIREKLRELSYRRDRWIPKLGGFDIDMPEIDNNQEMHLLRNSQLTDMDVLIGVDKYRETLTKLLCTENCSPRIITILGMGGLGKSTLVHHVYKREGSRFDCRAWISVSQLCNIDNILRNMYKELNGSDKQKESDVAKMNVEELRVNLKKFLNKKRYIIILDDVWRAAILLEIAELLFRCGGKRSILVITTRIDEVASIAEDECKIKLEPLNEHDAWILFCRKVFWKIKNPIVSHELQKWGQKIVKKCEGLPLAIVAIGSLLSLRDKSETEWKCFYSQLIWELQNNPDLNHVEWILNLSYKHLPNYLKNCFLYCAMFPEDYLLRRKKLIRLWVAEGFIEDRGAMSMEEVAESYLIELVHRSMLQVTERNSFGRIRRFRMHDLVRELAIKLSEKESFNSTYDDTSGVIEDVSDARRVSVLRCNKDLKQHINSYRLRTFLLFDTTILSSSWSSLIPSKYKYLAVLDLSGLPIETIPHSIGELFNLKYLCLNDTNLKSLPKSVTRLHNLQTLGLERTQLVSFPRGFAKLKKLRHILVWKLLDTGSSSFNHSIGVRSANDNLWDLKELQTLDEIRSSGKFISNLVQLVQLRSLYISDVRSNYCSQLSSLSKLEHLLRLNVKACNKDEVLMLETLTLPPQLHTLQLTGRLAEGVLKSPMFSAHGNTLVRLSLCWCHLAENPIPYLSKLSNLTSLQIKGAYDGQELGFRDGWFPKLKGVSLAHMEHITQIYIEKGALICLEYLRLGSLKELVSVPDGMEFLSSIQEVYFHNLHPNFRQNLQESVEKGRLKHIPVMHFQ
ncbi:hypothetical protein HU200_021271 [Digitaria exilis]|uniref:Uncharacterized protein n=1 Tax=Digitaria exilis TaxID=1010633 RepID=A0A835F039_9POAL|nr:hypothetical protein HU200_021271 [Digitaria exilis]